MSVLRTAPWWRAPLLLLRRPAVLAALAGTFALLGIAAASGPLFLSSAGAAALQRRVAAQCPEADRPEATTYQLDAAGTRAAETGLRGGFATAGLPAPYRVVVSDVTADFGARRTPTPLTVYGRDDALDHVTRLRGGGPGLWVSDLDSERYEVAIGDTVAVGALRLPVAGIYRDLAGRGFDGRVDRYWCTWSQRILPSLERRPPPFLLADRATTDRLLTELAGQDPVPLPDEGTRWYAPVDTDRLTLADADVITGRASRAARTLESSFVLRSGLPDDVAAARTTRDGVRGAIVPVALAGIGVAVLLVGAAASFWADQRRAELRLLAARGVGPAGLAVKALLEMVLPAAVGAAVGWLTAMPLVRAVGPAPQLEPGAAGDALRAVLPALAAGLLALAAVAAARTTERTRRRRRPVPWELVLLGLAGWAYVVLRRRDAVVADPGDVVRVDPLLVTFGLVGTTGAVLLAARLLTALLPLARRRTATAATAVHLAVRRLAGLRTATAAVLVATAVPVAILGYASAVTRSSDATVTAKARTYAGTERAVVLNARPAETVPLGDTGTQVSVVRDAHIVGTEDEVLGVDPATFARFAYTDRDVFGVDVAGLVGRLTGSGVPAIAVRCPRCTGDVPVTLGRTTLRATVVGTARLFPGLRVRDATLLVVPRSALADVDPYANRTEEVWTTEDRLPAALAALERADRPPRGEVSPGRFLGVTQLLPVTWTFGYLQALAVLIGLIAVAGLFLFLSARQRSTLVAYVLLRRVGLSRRAHLGSLAGELAAVLLTGWLLGALAAVGFAAAARGLLEVNPLYPPGVLLVVPVALLLLGALVLLGVAAAGALATQRVADAADPATLLRGAAD